MKACPICGKPVFSTRNQTCGRICGREFLRRRTRAQSPEAKVYRYPIIDPAKEAKRRKQRFYHETQRRAKTHPHPR